MREVDKVQFIYYGEGSMKMFGGLEKSVRSRGQGDRNRIYR